METIKEQLHEYITQNYFFDPEAGLEDTDSFLELGIIDSVGILELVSYIEKKYGIEVNADELVPENLDSIENVANLVQRKREARDVANAKAIG